MHTECLFTIAFEFQNCFFLTTVAFHCRRVYTFTGFVFVSYVFPEQGQGLGQVGATHTSVFFDNGHLRCLKGFSR
jgi:hypothetical protein